MDRKVVACVSSCSGGWSLDVKDGKPSFRYTFGEHTEVSIPEIKSLPEEKVTLKTDFIPACKTRGTFAFTGRFERGTFELTKQ